MSSELIVNDEAALRKRCDPVSRKDGLEIVSHLMFWMRRNNVKANKRLSPSELKGELNPRRPMAALGLAAPQLGIHKQVCVTCIKGVWQFYLNPRIVAHSATLIPWEEGCLSFPGKLVDTYRFAWVKVMADNLDEPRLLGPQTPQDWCGDNLLKSVVAQHEIGHLSSRLMMDFTTKEYDDPCVWFDVRPVG